MGRARLIDLAFADLSPWSVEIIRGAEQAAAAEGCRIAVSVVSGEAATVAWLARLSGGQIDGVILVLTELAPVYREKLAAMFLPVVIVDPVGQPDPRIPSVGATNWAGGLMATEHLIGSATAESGSSPAARRCCAARPGWTATGRRWGVRAFPLIPA